MKQKIVMASILICLAACAISDVSYSVELNYDKIKMKIIKVKYYNEETGQEEEKIIYKPSYGRSWFKGNGIGFTADGKF